MVFLGVCFLMLDFCVSSVRNESLEEISVMRWGPVNCFSVFFWDLGEGVGVCFC